MSHHKINFSKCVFYRIVLNEYTLIKIDGDLIDIRKHSCIFKYNIFQAIQTNDYTQSAYHGKSQERIITLINAAFLEISCNQYLIHLTKSTLFLAGAVKFTAVKQSDVFPSSIIYYVSDMVSGIIFTDYIEFSDNLITTISFNTNHAFVNTFVIIQEHTVLNMSNNTLPSQRKQEIQKDFLFSSPCFFNMLVKEEILIKKLQLIIV